jgi:hypothetical protein
VEDQNFLEKSEQLITLAIDLIKKDRDYGLDALMTVAKRFADYGCFDKAKACTDLASKWRKETTRGPQDASYILPVTEMCRHLVCLNQYELAKEYFRSIEREYFHPDWLPKEIGSQTQEELFENNVLTGTLSWDMAEQEYWDKILFGTAKFYREKGKECGDGLVQIRRYGAAIAAYASCPGATAAFKELFQVACKRKRYDIAMICQQNVQKIAPDMGNQAMRDLIISHTKEPFFLESLEELINLSRVLIKKNSKLGLDALMAVAKRLTECKKFDRAMELTEQAEQFKAPSTRKKILHNDILPFAEMCKHLLTLKNYELLERCAQNLERDYLQPDWLCEDFGDLANQIQRQNFIPLLLVYELGSGTHCWIKAENALWKDVFEGVDLLQDPEKYKRLWACLLVSGRYGAAIALCEKYATFDLNGAAFYFVQMIKFAVYNNDYALALEFLRHAKLYDPFTEANLDRYVELNQEKSVKMVLFPLLG